MRNDSQRDGPERARYIMIGGFLGAGKTTAVAALAQHLQARGVRLGLITNDQSTNLVDTAILRSRGFAVEEIAGGCFCCRFDSLHQAAEKLTRETRPDLFIAEPVGSCTDLVATVSYPLRRIYKEQFVVAPLSVLVDPVRAARILGLEPGRSFSEKVQYVYRKQLEEADVIVINKSDLVSREQQERLRESLSQEFPQARILVCSALEGDGLEEWFGVLETGDCAESSTMTVDYQAYAEGEALLGWLNCTVRLAAEETVDANALLLELSTVIRDQVAETGHEIAHLKMTLDSKEAGGNLTVVSLVGTDASPDLRESLLDGVKSGTLIINLRAEADPELLRSVTTDALSRVAERHGISLGMEHLEFFRPSKPVPQHRVWVTA